jgi:UDP-hydrolysing UDP-N-acetyl-D-glucosamine 2-epimerase
MKKRKITVVTGTRAEYGILKPLLEEIRKSNNLKLKLIVTGMHLLKRYGLTINEIKRDGFKVEKIVKMYFGNEKDSEYHGRALGKGIRNFTKVLSGIKPDILVVLGDRLEPLAATLAAATLKITIAHIHGGDKTDSGHIDECIRHTITRFAHIHFAPTKKCKERLIKMGEEGWRIHNVGALNLDTILRSPKIKKEILFKKLELNLNPKIILCIFNPVHLEAERMGEQMCEIIKALKELKIQTVIIYPNNDAGSQDIIKEIKKVKNLSFIKIFPSLFHTEYISLLKYADVLIGNSSSGIIEAPAMKLPVVNIGSRNVGREHAQNVIFVEANKNKIIKAIKKALYDKKFRKIIQRSKNPYGDGKTSNRIIKILSKIEIDKKLLQKKITY